jgi:drug/metabolite transporter (DMT)-like permease
MGEASIFRPVVSASIFSMLGLMVAGSLLMKLGASGDPAKRWFFSLVGTQSIIGIGCYGIALVLYAWLLKQVPLNVMQSLTAAQFIAIIVLSAVFLAEPIPPMRWVGIGLIAAGLWIVAMTVNRTGAV